MSSCVLGLFFAAVVGSLPGMIVSGGAVAVLVAAAAVSRRTPVDVVAAFSQRGLEPVQRETSARRDLRQLQLAVVATLVTFVALGALLWSIAWVFGDEQVV